MVQITLLHLTVSLLLNLAGSIALPSQHKRSHSSGQEMTYFYPGMGACGWENSSSDLIIAIPGAKYDKGKHCGKHVMIRDPKTGKELKVKVADECPSPYCSSTHIDVSPSVFKHFAPESQGVHAIEWWFLES